MVRGATEDADPFGTARLRRGVLDAWAASPARFREDANAEEDLALGGHRDRLVVEMAQNAADAAARAGVPGRLRLTLRPAIDGEPAVLAAANTGAPLDAVGVESLSTLRASAKRDEPESAVGRFGVGFAAVLAVSDEPAVVGRTGGVRWSLAEARELTQHATATSPGLAEELRRRDGHVPLLRLPLPAEGIAPAGYDTVVVLPLRDGAALDVAERLLAGIDDALLLTLPGLAEVVVETVEGTRTLRRRQEGPYTVIEDTGEGSREDTGEDSREGSRARGTTRWRTESAGGRLEPELLADRPVEERLRPVWSVTWAVPVDAEGAPMRSATAPVVHAPTPTDEPLGMPALLIASFPLEPTRRHTAPGPLTDFLLDRAAESYATLLRDWHPVSVGTIDLVPGQLGRGELDGELRRRVLERLPRVPFLPSAAAPAVGAGTEAVEGWLGSPDALGPDAAQGGPAAGDAAVAAAPPVAAADSPADWDDDVLARGGFEGEPHALRPRDAEVVEGAGAETVEVLAELFPTLLPAGLERRSELRVLGVARVPLGELIDRLAGVERAPAWWRRLYDSLGGIDPDRLSGLPVPLADGRTTIGPRQVLLPLPGEADGDLDSIGIAGAAESPGAAWAAESAGMAGTAESAGITGTTEAPERGGAVGATHRTLARLGLKVAHPDAAHPLLEKLGATPATPRAVLTTPQVRAAVAHSLEAEDEYDPFAEEGEALGAALDADTLADTVLGLVQQARLAPGDEPWLAALALPDEDGELAPAGELVLPGSAFEQVMREGELAACDAELAERWGEQPLAAVGVLAVFTLVRATDVVLDPDELEPREGDFTEPDDVGVLDAVDVWCEDVLDRLPQTPVPPVATEIVAVRDLDLVDDDAWPRALAMLAQPPLRDALTAPVRVLLPDGTTETVRSYTAWWLRGNPVLDGRRPAGLRAAGGDPLLAGLYEAVDAAGFEDEQVLRALGVRTSVAVLLDEPGGAAELLARLADPDREVTPAQLHAIYGQLADLEPEQVTLPDDVRAIVDGEPTVVEAGEALVADAPDLMPLAEADGRALLPVRPTRAAELAELFQVRRLSEAYPARVTSQGDPHEVPEAVRELLPGAPLSYIEHEELLIEGEDELDWRYVDGTLHASTVEGVAAGLAWAAGHWSRRFEVAALLEDLTRTEELARARWFD
ncbi:sacsin N-terminal ATP-binding-like domain-containing protein [Streptomyces sp. NEAU-YJ-81]|uniref:sacsin N-terminal ATP-binding-like domain-containing protein n=1 Tax=Streptomyces sp. NEAU-YJ-81 TaxID=2820288 RepID=UPI001ABC3B9B|nr:molecular chaperone Hsp90 [Streptomyces sp. NEAU-YJ-81]MBO3674292.1 molecular chaperone Hsp90 [Streptomyces sp. NEAU-YJ-81]